MSRLRYRRNFSFASLNLAPGRAAMQAAGQHLAARTVARTQSGLDEDNRKFAPYSRRSKGTVDLTDTGQMLNDYQPVAITDRTVGLGFRTIRSECIADAHQSGKGTLPVRRFTGIPKAWVQAVRALLAAALRL